MTGTLGYLRHLTERAGVASMNKHQTNILVGVLLGSLLAVAILLFPVFLMVGNEIYGRYEAKKQLNNPYINQHYVDWSKISLSPLDIQFRLPSDWTFSFEEGNHSIYDALGEEIAIFNTQAERMDVGAFVQSVTGITVSSIKRTSLQYTCFGTRVSLTSWRWEKPRAALYSTMNCAFMIKLIRQIISGFFLNGTILYQIQNC